MSDRQFRPTLEQLGDRCLPSQLGLAIREGVRDMALHYNGPPRNHQSPRYNFNPRAIRNIRVPRPQRTFVLFNPNALDTGFVMARGAVMNPSQ